MVHHDVNNHEQKIDFKFIVTYSASVKGREDSASSECISVGIEDFTVSGDALKEMVLEDGDDGWSDMNRRICVSRSVHVVGNTHGGRLYMY